MKIDVEIKRVSATILKLEEGEALLIRVDPEEFTEEMMQPFMDALESMMVAAGHDTARCMVVSANTLELSIIKA